MIIINPSKNILNFTPNPFTFSKVGIKTGSLIKYFLNRKIEKFFKLTMRNLIIQFAFHLFESGVKNRKFNKIFSSEKFFKINYEKFD